MRTYMRSKWAQFGITLGAVTIASIGFWLVAVLANNSFDYWYLLWNLFLAWLPFIFSFAVVWSARKHGWRAGKTITFAALWFVFLPNAFYMITDYIHLQEYMRSDVMLDIVMFTMFVLTGLTLGFASVLMVHQELRKKIVRPQMAVILSGAFLLCGFALYLGRELRWNTWDLISNPFGIIFNISDLIIHPGAHPQAFESTLLFFVFLSVLYAAIYRSSKLLKH